MLNRDDLEKRLEKHTRVLKDENVKKAIKAVDRKDFVRSDLKEEAYEDYPLPIGEGQIISQPTTVAFMLELLEVERGHKVLDIGSGSGWTTALLAHIVGEKGEIYGVERIDPLIVFGRKNLQKAEVKNAEIFPAKDDALGLPEYAPFDRILVSAAANSDEAVDELLEQLVDDGILVIPIQDSVVKFKKTNAKIEKQEFPGFAFVPLV